ncbi:unnamed protein product [Bursaphelenchus xylophilus]|nr:unnamed protein product [Bursaphelenchus xylophilus]CAG9129399.1 unnamed protein product [Bursaphelenchus xylophilus]
MYYFAVLSGAGIALTFAWSCGKNRRNSLKKRIPKALSISNRSKKSKKSARTPSQGQSDRKNVPGGFGSVKSSNRVKKTTRKERDEKKERKQKSSKGQRNNGDRSKSRRSSNSSSKSNKSQSSQKSARKLRRSKSNGNDISGKDDGEKSASTSQKSQDKTEKDFSGRSWRKSLQDNDDSSKQMVAPTRQHEVDIDEDDRSMKPQKPKLKKRSKLSKKPEKSDTSKKDEKSIKKAAPTASGTVVVEPEQAEQQKDPHVDGVISQRFKISSDSLITPTPTKASDSSTSSAKPAQPLKTIANAPNPMKNQAGTNTSSISKKNESVGTKKLRYRQIPSRGKRTLHAPKKSKFRWFRSKAAKEKT